MKSPFFLIALSKACNFDSKSEISQIFDSKCWNNHCKTSCGKWFSGNDLFFVVMQQNKVKGIPSSIDLPNETSAEDKFQNVRETKLQKF